MLTSNEITREYEKNTIEICRKRVALAGFRIANLAISIYEKSTQPVDVEAAWKEIVGQLKMVQ